MAPAPRHRALRSGLILVSAAAVALSSFACTRATSDESGARAQGAVAVTTSPSTTRSPEPDVLPDAGVAPGACKTLDYTPPTAKQKQPGELCRPANNQRDVAVIVVHGGSGISGSYANMRRWANRYLAEGYVTFLPEYHLFNVGGEMPVFPLPEQNIKAAVQFLRGTGNSLGIRKDRIVVQGQSAGARVGSVAYATANDPYFAGPELYRGISDAANAFIGFYHPYDGTMQFADQYFGGDDDSKDPNVQARLAKGDALSNSPGAAGPALFITGSKVWSIITDQQNEFAAALTARGVTSQAIVIVGGAHGFDEGGSGLSKLGEQSAVETLRFLNGIFPQNPAREPQITPIDVRVLPDYTGAPPTTARVRPRASSGARRGGGYTAPTNDAGATPTTAQTPMTSASAAPTTAVNTTTSPSSVTTAKPPTTTPPPTTAPPTTSGGGAGVGP